MPGPHNSVSQRPFIAKRRPYVTELKPGIVYEWCACGLSEDQPFCDGSSHRNTPFEPVIITVEERTRVALCQCKHSDKAPYCNGIHGDV